MGKALMTCIGVAIVWGAFQAIFFLGLREEIVLSDIIIEFSFSNVDIILVYLIEVSIRLLPLLLFQILFGTYIYKHFCTASIYYFSRCHNRIKWFMKECSKLYLLAFIYPLIMVSSGTMVTSITNDVVFDMGSIILLVYFVFIYSFWLFLTALLMNVIAIKVDSSLGFMVIVGLQLASVALLILWENVLPLVNTDLLERNTSLLQINPISHLILAWHSSTIEVVNDKINHLTIHFDLNNSVFVLLFICVVVVMFGCYVVKNQQWITFNKERGGI
ncbi:hypothetical protein [Bacillus alkalicellulosilyticus]|uniref:hypothetical protein n=1 Tax=Alkalihalobacterium alkalicellulosilyticum TaxID=1912214 RepID=UPI000996888B|nr:hypothetical protein [Bacillus alkalicellulosilyticus]